METLSKTREDELIAGVKAAVDLVDSQGQTPDEAIEKVARDNKWGKDMIRFASHAYNTGRQTAQRETGTSIMDKFAEFALADPAKIVSAVWPKTVKSAADDQQLAGVSDDYASPPAWLDSRQRSTTMEKSAAADDILAKQPKPPAYAPDPAVKMAQEHSKHVELQKEATEARVQTSYAHDEMVNALGQLGDYFKKHARDRLSFAAVEHAVATYFPQAAKKALDYAYTRNKMKEARAADTEMPKTAVDLNAAPFTLIKECLDTGARVSRLREFEKEAQAAVQSHREGDLAPFVLTSPPLGDKRASTSSKYLIPEDEPEKEANFLASVAGSSVADKTKSILDHALSDAPTSEARQKTLGELSDPQHLAEMRKIQAQALLAEMMDDEVIGGYEPEKVLNAYNEISQLSPRGAMQPIIARSLLRRHLQGTMEPFEAKEITDIEKGVSQVEAPAQSLIGQAANEIV
jgi:hypothetical protein